MILNHFQFRLVMVGHLTAGTSRRLPFITFHSSKLNWPFNHFCLNRKIKVFEKKNMCHLFLFLSVLQAQSERHRKHSMRICAKVLDARRERWSIFNKTLTFPSNFLESLDFDYGRHVNFVLHCIPTNQLCIDKPHSIIGNKITWDILRCDCYQLVLGFIYSSICELNIEPVLKWPCWKFQ